MTATSTGRARFTKRRWTSGGRPATTRAAPAPFWTGVVSHLRGDPIHANRLFNESLELFTRLHDVLGEASTHQWLGISSLTSGQVQAAADHFGQSLERWRRLGNAQMTA